jgi:hypothetical protein
MAGRRKKGRQRTADQRNRRRDSDVGFGLAEALDAIARLPLAAFLEDFDALEPLQDVAFNDKARLALEAFVL